MTRALRLLAFGALAVTAGTSGAMAQNLRQSATQLHRPQGITSQSYLTKSPTTQMLSCRWIRYTTPYMYDKNTCTGEVRPVLH